MPSTVVVVDTVKHPFSPTWIWIASGATVLGGGLTAFAYGNALAIYNGGAPSHPNDYYPARTLAYVSWAAPVTFAAVTIALALYYVGATKHLKVPTTAFAF